MADFIRSSDAIDNFNRLAAARDRMSLRLSIDPADLTPELLAGNLTDPETPRPRRRQQIKDLLDYAKLIRGVDADDATAALDRLNTALGMDLAANRATANLLADPPPEVVAALTEFARTLGDLDPYTDRLRFDPATDPRAVDGEVAMHDPAAPDLLRDAWDRDGMVGEPRSDDPSDAPTVWARLLGIDLTPPNAAEIAAAGGDFAAAEQAYWARVAEVYDLYRDGRLDQHERLTPEQLAAELDELRAEVRARDAEIDALEALAARYNELTAPASLTPDQAAADLATAAADRDNALAARDSALRAMAADTDPDRPIRSSDLTPQRLSGALDYLSHRSDPSGPRYTEAQLDNLRQAAEAHHRAESALRTAEAGHEAATRPRPADEPTQPVDPREAWMQRGEDPAQPVDPREAWMRQGEEPAQPVDPREAWMQRGEEPAQPVDLRVEWMQPGQEPAQPVDPRAEWMQRGEEMPQAEQGLPQQPAESPAGQPVSAPGDWPRAGLPQVYIPTSPQMRAELQQAVDRAHQATERARIALDEAEVRLGEIADDLGVALTEAGVGPAWQRITEWLDAENARLEQLMDPDFRPDRTVPEYFADRDAAQQRLDELRPIRNAANDARTAAINARNEAANAWSDVNLLAARDIMTASGARVVSDAAGILPGNPQRVLVVTPLADPTPAIGPDLRDSLAAQGIPIEYRQLEIHPDGQITHVQITPPTPPSAPTPPAQPPSTPPQSPQPSAEPAQQPSAPPKSGDEGGEPPQTGGPVRPGGPSEPDSGPTPVARPEPAPEGSDTTSGDRDPVSPPSTDEPTPDAGGGSQQPPSEPPARNADDDGEPSEPGGQPDEGGPQAETPRAEYERLLQERRELARELEFQRAKRDARVGRLLDVGDPEAALGTRDRLQQNALRLFDEAGSRVVGVGDEGRHQERVQNSPAEQQRRLAEVRKLIAAAEEVIGLREQVREIDRRIHELERDRAAAGLPRPAEVIAEMDRLAAERADELQRIKPRRNDRDELALDLGSLDAELAHLAAEQRPGEPDTVERLLNTDGSVNEAALSHENLGELLRRLHEAFPERAGDLDRLRAAAEDVNQAHNRIGRIQDEMARIAGEWRRIADGEGARMVTPRVAIADGQPRRIIVFGPRDELGRPFADHDRALAEALLYFPEVAQALADPNTVVERLRVTVGRDDEVSVTRSELPVNRLTAGGNWSDRVLSTRWRDGDGNWHEVNQTRPNWTENRGSDAWPDEFKLDMAQGLSGWAADQVQGAVVGAVIDRVSGLPPGAQNQDLLPHIPGGKKPVADPDEPTFVLPFADLASNVMRIILEVAKLFGFTWFGDSAQPARISPKFKGSVLFGQRVGEIQPMIREFDRGEHAADVEPSRPWHEANQAAAERWAAVQRWADEQYDGFLHDDVRDGPDNDVAAIADNLAAYRDARREDLRAFMNEALSVFANRPGANLTKLIARVTGLLGSENADYARQLATDLRDNLLRVPADDRDELFRALDEQLRAAVDNMLPPAFTPEQVQQIKNHLMRDPHWYLDPVHNQWRQAPLDAVADVAEAWNRLIAGNPLPPDILLLQDALAESNFLRANPNATWADANAAVAAIDGYHWDAHRPPLTGNRAGIPYVPGPPQSRPYGEPETPDAPPTPPIPPRPTYPPRHPAPASHCIAGGSPSARRTRTVSPPAEFSPRTAPGPANQRARPPHPTRRAEAIRRFAAPARCGRPDHRAAGSARAAAGYELRRTA
ncbi:hypothetical protein [Nocardia crassostreae]|uniref:hypothetical protein n=1 Tax=Nocardia crassostreae TaxID=53428 RepID=UPI000829B97F|nr:hypothetical protein [Nocardia crassostreae]